jgi:hypothetical protein
MMRPAPRRPAPVQVAGLFTLADRADRSGAKETMMAKGQKHGNREIRKNADPGQYAQKKEVTRRS